MDGAFINNELDSDLFYAHVKSTENLTIREVDSSLEFLSYLHIFSGTSHKCRGLSWCLPGKSSLPLLCSLLFPS